MIDDNSAQHTAYTDILRALTTGALTPGDRISPEVIGARLAISRMPVRDAIIRLAAEGFIALNANRGAFVRRFTADEIREQFEIRAVLEGLAGRFCAINASDADIDGLERAAATLRQLEDSHPEWLSLHDDFHLGMALIAGRPLLYAEIRRRRLIIRPYFGRFSKAAKEREITGFEHEGMLDHIRRRDPDAAEASGRAHVMENAARIAAFVGTNTVPAGRRDEMIRFLAVARGS